MARVAVAADTQVFQIKKWLGINEHADGDTRLKMGEASAMRNWRVTDGGSLQIRPGSKTVFDLAPVRGMWSGYVKGISTMVCAQNGYLCVIDPTQNTIRFVGTLKDVRTEFFGYGEKLYVLNGSEYKVFDGEQLVDVDGYRPLVVTAAPPSGGGTLLEASNLLTGKKRVRFSPDGTAKTFVLPEKDLLNIDYVTDLSTGDGIENYTVDLENGTVTIDHTLSAATNSLEVGYIAKNEDGRKLVSSMRFAEIYNGSTDNRVFLYGNGSNKAIYSGLDENGMPTAEYFPAMNEISVGEANTPITSMIRHFSRLLVFKSNSTYSVQYDAITKPDGTVTAGFYVTPVNRTIGNAAYGQVRLVENNPRSLHGKALYEWRSANGYLTADERQAKHISGRISSTLESFDATKVYAFDDDVNQEYYLVQDGKAIVQNYRQDAWYIYTNFPATCMVRHNGELYYGTESGQIRHFDRTYRNDDLDPIDAVWRSGLLAFNRDWQRKYTSTIWVAMMVENGARVSVSARSNRKSDYPEKVIAYSMAGFANVDFNHWSFNTNRQAQVRRVRLKVKKYTYYQLVIESHSSSATATIVGTDIQVRYNGNVK